MRPRSRKELAQTSSAQLTHSRSADFIGSAARAVWGFVFGFCRLFGELFPFRRSMLEPPGAGDGFHAEAGTGSCARLQGFLTVLHTRSSRTKVAVEAFAKRPGERSGGNGWTAAPQVMMVSRALIDRVGHARSRAYGSVASGGAGSRSSRLI